MKIYEILPESSIVENTAGAVASIAMPLFGDEKMIRRAVDPNGYLGNGKKKKPKVGYVNPVKESVHKMNPDDPMNPEVAVSGYGVMNLETLKRAVKRDLDNIMQKAEVGSWDDVDYLLKKSPLPAKIDAIIQAYKDLEQIRRRGGKSSRGIQKGNE
jgi:hypothetical protein